MASGVHIYCGYVPLDNGEYQGGFRIIYPDGGLDICLACTDATFPNSVSATSYAETASESYLALLRLFGMIPPGNTIIRQDVNPN